MPFGICNLSSISLRKENSNTSEMTNQILFGEFFIVLEKDKVWSKVLLFFDDYEGYILNNQYEEISEELYQKLANEKHHFSEEIIEFIAQENGGLITIPIGANLPCYHKNFLIFNHTKVEFKGRVSNKMLPKTVLLNMAFSFLNAPFLWGGKTLFGIDSSALIHLVYRLCGYRLPRDIATQSATGEVLSFIEESEPGDLAFFDDENGNIIHIGMILKDYTIIHSYGKVRVDILDHTGIFNTDTQIHTHKLRVIRKII